VRIVNFIKKELSGWSKYEAIFVPFFLLLIFSVSVYMKDSKVATASALFGLTYTILAGKGKISCFFFGLQGTLCYSYLSFENAIYGNMLLYMGYYFPMQILGIFKWKNNLKKDNNEIKKTMLSNKERFLLSFITIISTIVFGFILKNLNDSAPFLDSCATILSIVGMYLTVKRCIEQWIIWTIVNAITIVIWFNILVQGGNTFATLLMWCSYLFLGVYFFFKWKKEMLLENSNC